MRIEYRAVAKEQLKAFPVNVQERIAKKMVFFASQKNPLSFAKPLAGYNAYRYRIGNYRAVVEVSDDTIFVLLIVKREGAYRNL